MAEKTQQEINQWFIDSLNSYRKTTGRGPISKDLEKELLEYEPETSGGRPNADKER